MLFAKGTRVQLIHTGDEGQIIDQLSDGLLMIRLDDGDEIPAFEEDLKRLGESVKIPKPKAAVTAPPPAAKIASNHPIDNPLGIQIAFENVATQPGMAADYRIHLINDTAYSFIFTFAFYLADVLQTKVNDKLDPATAIALGKMAFDQLNDFPKIELECWQITTAGTGQKLAKTLKVKPKQFLRKIAQAPILNKEVHHYLIFDSFEKSTDAAEDLRTYTQRNARPVSRSKYTAKGGNTFHPSDFASFVNELDLHIEKLTNDHQRMGNADILRMQLQHFDSFLSKAIRLGIDRVFVIHGLGKGKLRDSIASRLIRHPDVETFKNEYHPKYGYGATEVLIVPR